jgi:hypothetical protein
MVGSGVDVTIRRGRRAPPASARAGAGASAGSSPGGTAPAGGGRGGARSPRRVAETEPRAALGHDDGHQCRQSGVDGVEGAQWRHIDTGLGQHRRPLPPLGHRRLAAGAVGVLIICRPLGPLVASPAQEPFYVDRAVLPLPVWRVWRTNQTMNLATVALIEAESSELVMIHLCPLCCAEARQVRLVFHSLGVRDRRLPRPQFRRPTRCCGLPETAAARHRAKELVGRAGVKV